jgi:hypothetical protein
MSPPSSGSKSKPSYLFCARFLLGSFINSENGGGGRIVPPKRRLTFNGLHGVISLGKSQFLVSYELNYLYVFHSAFLEQMLIRYPNSMLRCLLHMQPS